ncbi:MAG: pyridoxal phosphate-dependent aminotransferase [Myxococcales bacterium]|nr:pyridoxal phosphate-dependent aminotransferase [Myxococcales bacterium]
MNTDDELDRRFSEKSAWREARTPWNLAVAALRDAATPHWDLTQTNPTDAELPYPVEALMEIARQTSALPYDPAPLGTASARRSLVDRLAAGHDPDDVCLAASTSELYRFLLDLLCDAGDNILVPAPGYPLFDMIGDLNGVELRFYPLLEADGWSIDLDALEAAVDSRTRAIIVVTPNNPTGSCIDHEWPALIELCLAQQLTLISDEVFAPYRFRPTDGGSLLDAAGAEQILHVALGGLSKYAALPGHKLSWAFVGGPTALRRTAMRRLETIADTFLSPSSSVQAALPALLDLAPEMQRAIRGRCLENLSQMESLAATSAVTPLRPTGGWSALLKMPRILDDEAWGVRLLTEARVVLQPGSLYRFGGPGFLVASLLTPTERWREGMSRISAVVDRFG